MRDHPIGVYSFKGSVMVKKVLTSFVLLIMCAAIVRATDRNAATQPQIRLTPCAPGVVYIQVKSRSHVMQAVSGKGSAPQSIGASAFDKVTQELGMIEIVPFDATAPKDSITHTLGIDRIFCL